VKVDVARLYAIGWKVAGKVPGSLLRGAFNVVADVTWLRRTGGVVQLEKNLRRARPDLDARSLRRLTRAGMRSYMRYFGEAFTLATMSRDVVDARVRGVNLQNVVPHTQGGQGVILALGHNLAWNEAFDGAGPSLGGNLEGTLSPRAEEIVLRAAASISSLFTGAGTGLVCGLVAVLVQALRRRSADRR